MDAGSTTAPDLLAADSNVASHSRDPRGGAFRDTFYSLSNTAASGGIGVGTFFFNVEVLRVLTNNDKVERGEGPGDCLYRANVGIKVKAFAEGNNRRGVASYFCSWRTGYTL